MSLREKLATLPIRLHRQNSKEPLAPDAQETLLSYGEPVDISGNGKEFTYGNSGAVWSFHCIAENGMVNITKGTVQENAKNDFPPDVSIEDIHTFIVPLERILPIRNSFGQDSTGLFKACEETAIASNFDATDITEPSVMLMMDQAGSRVVFSAEIHPQNEVVVPILTQSGIVLSEDINTYGVPLKALTHTAAGVIVSQKPVSVFECDARGYNYGYNNIILPSDVQQAQVGRTLKGDPHIKPVEIAWIFEEDENGSIVIRLPIPYDRNSNVVAPAFMVKNGEPVFPPNQNHELVMPIETGEYMVYASSGQRIVGFTVDENLRMKNLVSPEVPTTEYHASDKKAVREINIGYMYIEHQELVRQWQGIRSDLMTTYISALQLTDQDTSFAKSQIGVLLNAMQRSIDPRSITMLELERCVHVMVSGEAKMIPAELYVQVFDQTIKAVLDQQKRGESEKKEEDKADDQNKKLDAILKRIIVQVYQLNRRKGRDESKMSALERAFLKVDNVLFDEEQKIAWIREAARIPRRLQ